MTAHGRQRGVALITVMLVVALATIAAVHMTTQNQLDQRRTGNRLALAQAHELALGGESWARAVLARDLREGEEPRIDSRDQAWAQILPPIPVEGGQVAGRIEDMQGRFNLNALVTGDRVNAIALERFERLLLALELEPEISQAVIDWLDENRETTFPGGAEDDYYVTREDPYLTANRPLAVESEMRLVRGFEDGVWRQLRPHVTALPQAGTAINVNTATPAVLQAIVPGLDRAGAESLHEAAEEIPFVDVQEFLDHPLVEAAGGEEVRADQLAVGSRFFRTRVDVELGPVIYTLYSWLERNDNGASRVLRRTRTAD